MSVLKRVARDARVIKAGVEAGVNGVVDGAFAPFDKAAVAADRQMANERRCTTKNCGHLGGNHFVNGANLGACKVCNCDLYRFTW